MERQHTYQLDKSSKKFICRGCGEKRMVKYLNIYTGIYLADHVGRCDREFGCSYHYKPKQYFIDNPSMKTSSIPAIQKVVNPELAQAVEFLPDQLRNKSVSIHARCSLYVFLQKLFGDQLASFLCRKYAIGSSREGHVTFWQVDFHNRVRQAKVMQYDPETGRRNKETGAQFIGKRVLGNEANLQQCFFGEHLLSEPENDGKPVAIVESEKTAVIASVYYPEFIWLATGGKNGARWTEQNVCSVLQGRQVILFPDLGAYEAWKEKGMLLKAVAGCQVAVSDLLEQIATEADKAAGLDIADFLLTNQDSSGLAMTDYDYPVIWDSEIKSPL